MFDRRIWLQFIFKIQQISVWHSENSPRVMNVLSIMTKKWNIFCERILWSFIFFKSFIQVARLQQINVNLTVICVYSSILHRIMFCLYCLAFAASCWKSGFQRSWVRSWSGRDGGGNLQKRYHKMLESQLFFII